MYIYVYLQKYIYIYILISIFEEMSCFYNYLKSNGVAVCLHTTMISTLNTTKSCPKS